MNFLDCLSGMEGGSVGVVWCFGSGRVGAMVMEYKGISLRYRISVYLYIPHSNDFCSM